MSSHTYHVVGYARTSEDPTKEFMYCAMSRVEMEQQRRKAAKDNRTMHHWFSQTATGERILGGPGHTYRLDKNVPRAKVIDCDVCDQHGCIVCNFSGVTTKNNKNKWAAWQLKSIRADALEKAELAGVWFRNSDNKRIEVSWVPHPTNLWYKDEAGEDVVIYREELTRDYHREKKAA